MKAYFEKYMIKLIIRLFLFYWKRISGKIRTEKSQLKSPRLMWGPIPIINNKYWSEALKKKGWKSTTFMHKYFDLINKKEDFDLYYSDVQFYGFQKFLMRFSKAYPVIHDLLLFDYAIKNFEIFHIPCSGGILGRFEYFQFEYYVMKMMGCKIIVMPFGGDFFRYSSIMDKCWTHALLSHYPDYARREKNITERVNFWIENADFFFSGSQIDGIGRWDTLTFNATTIDLELWRPRKQFSLNDGKMGTVKIAHAPNHRPLKGTEYILKAVNELKEEGLKIDFILIEKKQNSEVQRIFNEEADILIEQIVFSGYGLNAVEGMASGLAVISNFDDEKRTRVFRRYSYLNECPVVSANAENIKDILRLLIANPELRRQLGEAGRKFVEKYNSEELAQYMFGKIYEKIWFGKDHDLVNLFHPVFSDSYNNRFPKIIHPLFENKIPDSYKTRESL